MVIDLVSDSRHMALLKYILADTRCDGMVFEAVGHHKRTLYTDTNNANEPLRESYSSGVPQKEWIMD